MSAGILALKIGLVAGVTGVSVATPILLKRNSVGSTSIANQIPHSETAASGSEADTDQASSREERASADSHTPESPQRAADRSDGTHNQNQVTPASSQVTTEGFGKTCFEVPATSDSDSNMQLLTCFDTAKLKNAHKEGNPEFDSLFHLYNKSTRDDPTDVSEKLELDSEGQKIVASLVGSSGIEKYSFTVESGRWGGTLEKSTNLKRECAIFEVTANEGKTYWLACGTDSSDFATDEPKGIKLTNWERQ